MTKPKNTLADLAARYDKSVAVPKRIHAAIEAFSKAGDDWVYEGDLLTASKISNVDLAQFRDQFADWWTEVRETGSSAKSRRVWFATKALCKKWKETTSG
jgi:hypothetical protein